MHAETDGIESSETDGIELSKAKIARSEQPL